ncbi:hypothetical protein BSZ36_00080 [Rubricoccus marinus]|uniref:Methyltransferase type 11 domain-containing protein n=1 Tax=Rubricoccus marinus TaxID=716817 RepID=A0A259TUW5_9BACT|nr:hypothetical protein BSZ36_00080 [Rubricoccus marinus]
MQNEADWRPSKFVQTRRGLRASRDRAEVYVGSRLSADQSAQALERAIREHARGRLLDLGAGKAPLYGTYRPLVDTVTCIDWARSLHGTDYLDATADLNEGIPYPDGSFDTVLSSSVFEHLRRPQFAFEETARVMASGGSLILHVPFYYWLHEEPHDYYRFTEYALRDLASGAGLRVESVRTTGGGLYALADLMARALGPAKPLAAAWVGASGWALSRTPLRKLTEGDRARRFPLGYCMVARKEGAAGSH